MTLKEIELVKGCKEFLRELAGRVGLSVTIDEYQYGANFTNTVDINLRDKDGYLIYRSAPGSVEEIIGFIKGLQSPYTVPSAQ